MQAKPFCTMPDAHIQVDGELSDWHVSLKPTAEQVIPSGRTRGNLVAWRRGMSFQGILSSCLFDVLIQVHFALSICCVQSWQCKQDEQSERELVCPSWGWVCILPKCGWFALTPFKQVRWCQVSQIIGLHLACTRLKHRKVCRFETSNLLDRGEHGWSSCSR